MENPEEILHSLEEFAKLKPKDIPRELEEYLCFVAKTGDPVYQWSAVKSLFREKLISVITEFYESCPSVEIPPCPNVEMFNYDSMKNFILEKLDTFAAAPFTVQRICELLTTPRKEYNRIDKYMRALEKNILVVSTTEPGNRRNTENGEGIMNGIESEHIAEGNSNNDINVEEMDDTPVWPRVNQPETNSYQNSENNITIETQDTPPRETVPESFVSESRSSEEPSTSTESVITCRTADQPYVSIEPIPSESCTCPEEMIDSNVSVTITAIPAPVQKRRDSIEPVVSSDDSTPSESAATSAAGSKSEVKETESEDTSLEVQQPPEKENITEQENVTPITEAAEEGDKDLTLELQAAEPDLIETVSPQVTCNENKTTAVDFSGIVEKEELKPVSPVVAEQDAETSVESSDIVSTTATTDDNTDCKSSSDVVINKIVEESTTSEVINELAVEEKEKETASTVLPSESAASPTSEAEATLSVEEGCESSKDLIPEVSFEPPESQLVENVTDVQKLPTGTPVAVEDKGSEETPMEVDLDGEITTDTASTAPNVDTDTT